MSKKKQFSETLWYCGKKVGEMRGLIEFDNLPIFYQMRVGVLTQHGIYFTSRPILQDKSIHLKLSDQSQESHLKRLISSIDKLILSDIGKSKCRMTINETVSNF